MLIILFIILFLIILSAFFEDEMGDKKMRVYVFIGLLLAITCGLRPIGIDNDSENYEQTFLHYDDEIYEIAVEYSYLLLARFLNNFTDNAQSILIVYAFMGVGLKLYGIKLLSPTLFLPLVIYFGNYYLLHEMTQIRSGVACGMFLISIKYLTEGNTKRVLLLWLCAVLFHYSTIVLFPLLLLSNKTLSKRWKIVLLSIIPISYGMYFANINIITSIPLPYIEDKIELYQNLKDKGILGDEINVFNLVFVVKNIIFVYLLVMYDTVYKYNKNLPIMLKMMGISIALYVILSPLPVFAFRLSEIFGIVDIILFTNIYYTIKPNLLARSIVIAIGCILFAINIFYNDLLDISQL